ncbi:hypothetical protein [Lentzea aerocolonigenes]|uniref:hypothetical protein n=1 Tax=Lentzea aerocolonigenes TaxID=68170 RepID=UPI0012E29697|nr:hypothetical protein [Lentzea aerocolonigenes]
MISSITGLSARAVAGVRARVGSNAGVRIGRDGRVRPTNSAERRLRARELMAEQPHLSLRQVAKAVGISPETARTVRGELRGDRRPSRAPAAPRRGGVADLLRWLRDDPSMRLSHNGRLLLRLLFLDVRTRTAWAEVSRDVPAHCRPGLAELARQSAAAWQVLADRLDLELDSEGAA